MLFFAKYPHKQLIDRLAVTFWLAYCILNVISHNIAERVGGIGNILIVYVFLIFFLFFYGKPDPNRKTIIRSWPILVFCIIYIFFMQFLYNSSYNHTVMGITFEINVWNLITFIPMVLIAVLIVQKTKKENIPWIRTVFLIFSLITLLVSLTYLGQDYSLAKITATGRNEYIPFFFGFAIVYAFAVTSPIFFNCIASEHKNKVWWIAFFVIIVMSVFSASFLIACIVLILGTVLYFVLKTKNTLLRGTLAIAIIVFLCYVFFSGLWERFFLWLSEISPMEQLSIRLKQLVSYSDTGGVGDTTQRLRLYENSFLSILDHPILGGFIKNRNMTLSGHSVILDIWDGCGIIPMFIFVYYHFCIYKYNLMNFTTKHTERTALTASTIALLFAAVFNPIFASYNIVVFWIIAPMLFFDMKPGKEVEST